MLPAPEPNHQQAGSREPGPSESAAHLAWPFHRVLVGWDGSAGAAAAFRTAVALMAGAPGSVTALAVLADQPRPEAFHDHPAVPEGTQRVLAAFESARAAIAGARVRTSLQTTVDRHVAKAICGYAADHSFDLLVIGRHGVGGEWHPKLGHVAAAAAKDCKIPVLLVTN
jgi:nucleotide-binding universal stress UspA family protein